MDKKNYIYSLMLHPVFATVQWTATEERLVACMNCRGFILHKRDSQYVISSQISQKVYCLKQTIPFDSSLPKSSLLVSEELRQLCLQILGELKIACVGTCCEIRTLSLVLLPKLVTSLERDPLSSSILVPVRASWELCNSRHLDLKMISSVLLPSWSPC